PSTLVPSSPIIQAVGFRDAGSCSVFFVPRPRKPCLSSGVGGSLYAGPRSRSTSAKMQSLAAVMTRPMLVTGSTGAALSPVGPVAVGARGVSRPWSEQPTTASTPTSTAVTPLLSDLDLM